MLEIKNLHVKVKEKQILKGINLNIKPGEIHAIMGPNGSGKSTLSKVIAGHPSYNVEKGSIDYEIDFKNKSIIDMEPEERSRNGIFLAYQYPVEVPGVTNSEFLRAAFNSISTHQGAEEMDPFDFDEFLKEKINFLKMSETVSSRQLNVDFSGGEKKRNEILQMAVLSPRLSILDETDSGLDIDALKAVAAGVNKLQSSDKSLLMITHYQRLLNYIVPDYVHILVGGKIVCSGDKTLALEVEQNGYEKFL
jgi:Fe-S cluster assembly ATP-binding protein